MATLIFPFKFPVKDTTQSDGFNYCREFVDPAQAPSINIPIRLGDGQTSEFKMIKMNVPVKPSGYQGDDHVTEGPNILVNGTDNRQILYPTSDNGKSYDFNTEDGQTDITFAEFGIVFLRHLNADGTHTTVPGEDLEIIDIYQDVTKPSIPESEVILKCVDVGAESLSDPVVIAPEQEVSDDQKQVQMEWFTIKQTKTLPHAWWTPECKPAIYLYPGQKQLVNVKVFPKGHLTYVDPPYDLEKGWTVWANPNGALQAMNDERLTIYDYLYYESKIRDEAIKKPTKGWVVRYDELTNLYNSILPKLGLNEAETRDFVEYWEKSLPEAPYYFVGIVDPGNIDEIERLEITPKPDSINRVRVYFERLDTPKTVEAPILNTKYQIPNTNNFRVVEWGGMVKNDPNHPFTCSQ